MHHVLNGRRHAKAEILDAIISALGIHALDLYTAAELRAMIAHAAEAEALRIVEPITKMIATTEEPAA